jgi:DNA polymerase
MEQRTATSGELKAELADIAASLRAYLEVQQDTGAWGIPRAPKPVEVGPPTVGAELDPVPSFRAPQLEPLLPSERMPVPPRPLPTGTLPPPARTLPMLEAEVAACTKCELHATRTNTVFSRGNPASPLCFIGEAPGEDEDLQGKPFVGRAGQLLDRMISAMGMNPATDVYVCNIIKCRPPANRRPTPVETETCIQYLHDQLANVKPKVIVALGNTAVASLLGTKIGITKLRGEWKLYRGTTLVMPTYHPSYLIRPSANQAQSKKEAWEDLQKVMKELGIARVKT